MPATTDVGGRAYRVGVTSDGDSAVLSFRSGCTVVDHLGVPCAAPVDDDSGLSLCRLHLLEAHDWVVRGVGVTDLLPSACPACGSRLGAHFASGWICAVCEWAYGDIPDQVGTVVRVDVVYYIRYGERIKIGTTANPRARLAALPHHEVLAFERGDRTEEHARHLQFAEHRITGSEWFHAHDALTRHVEILGAGSVDPWREYARWMSERLALGT